MYLLHMLTKYLYRHGTACQYCAMREETGRFDVTRVVPYDTTTSLCGLRVVLGLSDATACAKESRGVEGGVAASEIERKLGEAASDQQKRGSRWWRLRWPRLCPRFHMRNLLGCLRLGWLQIA